jgi:ABC-type polar amino acid transport system ATPase subunit
VAPGSTFAILGRSGTGKTTALKVLNLLLLAHAGTIKLNGDVYFRDGAILFDPREVRVRIGMVFQTLNLFPNLTVLQNICLALNRVKGVPQERAETAARRITEPLGIGDLLDRYPESLSGGEAQRAALARAVVLEPSVLLLDEITSSLDPEAVRNVCQSLVTLRKLSEGERLAIVLVTHNIHFALAFADTVALLHEGQLVDALPAKEFLRAAQNPATRSYLSDLSEIGAVSVN